MKYNFDISCKFNITVQGQGFKSKEEVRKHVLKQLKEGEYDEQIHNWAEVSKGREEK